MVKIASFKFYLMVLSFTPLTSQLTASNKKRRLLTQQTPLFFSGVLAAA